MIFVWCIMPIRLYICSLHDDIVFFQSVFLHGGVVVAAHRGGGDFFLRLLCPHSAETWTCARTRACRRVSSKCPRAHYVRERVHRENQAWFIHNERGFLQLQKYDGFSEASRAENSYFRNERKLLSLKANRDWFFFSHVAKTTKTISCQNIHRISAVKI